MRKIQALVIGNGAYSQHLRLNSPAAMRRRSQAPSKTLT